jgi:pimeloyl-ACP methyl ester carboxylesterase
LKAYQGKHFEICYQAWGNPKNRAVIFFHGFPGYHGDAKFLAPILEENNIFLLSADRPGYGGTTGSGSASQYLKDLHDLATGLGVDRMDILGVSGGSPYAHVMASMFADRVRSLGIVCGLGPLNKETLRMFSVGQLSGLLARRYLPQKMSALVIDLGLHLLEPEKSLSKFLKTLNEVDRKTLEEPVHRALILDSMKVSRQQGGKGIHFDTGFYQRDWLKLDCDLEELAKIPTFYFHGRQDEMLPSGLSSWMHKNNPHSKLQFFDSEGHYSLPFKQSVTIFNTLVQV